MSNRILPLFLTAAMACAIAAPAFTLAAPALAQPYDDSASTSVGEIIVAPPARPVWDRETGRFVDRDYATRVVDLSDLDLSTGWGIHELKVRVDRAARAVCDELSDRDGDDPDADRACFRAAIDHALNSVPEYVGFTE